MKIKSYNQYCPVAHSLDIVGGRWTLLVIRNLMTGPKRFSDLTRGLPGISTNILTERLNHLEQKGIIQMRYLPPPAASNVYELTEYGQGLRPVLVALAEWGIQTLGEPSPTQVATVEALQLSLSQIFTHEVPPDFVLTCRVQIRHGDNVYEYDVTFDVNGVTIIPSSGNPHTLEIQMELRDMAALNRRQTTLTALYENGRITVVGDNEFSFKQITQYYGE
ncbi:MAG: helix-turn-helix domain-containing protein [Chloroflexota bacterium]